MFWTIPQVRKCTLHLKPWAPSASDSIFKFMGQLHRTPGLFPLSGPRALPPLLQINEMMVLLPVDMSSERPESRRDPFRESQEFFDAHSSISQQSDYTEMADIQPAPESTEGEEESSAPTDKHICLLVLGPSGSGKSTFVAAVSGLEEDSGIIGHGLDSCEHFPSI